MVQNRRLGCLNVNSCAKGIAWVEIIFSIIATIAILITAIIYWVNTPEESERPREEKEGIVSPELSILLWMLFMALLAFLNILMAFMLLHGVTKREIQYLNGWLGYRVIQTFIIVISFYLLLLFDCTTCIVVTALLLVTALALALFTLFMIRSFMHGLGTEDGQGMVCM